VPSYFSKIALFNTLQQSFCNWCFYEPYLFIIRPLFPSLPSYFYIIGTFLDHVIFNFVTKLIDSSKKHTTLRPGM